MVFRLRVLHLLSCGLCQMLTCLLSSITVHVPELAFLFGFVSELDSPPQPSRSISPRLTRSKSAPMSDLAPARLAINP